MILDTVQQIPMDSVLDCLEGTTHNKVIRTPAPGISIVMPVESYPPPVPFREYKVKSVRKGRGFYWVRVETLGEMKTHLSIQWLMENHAGVYAAFVREYGERRNWIARLVPYFDSKHDPKPTGTPLPPVGPALNPSTITKVEPNTSFKIGDKNELTPYQRKVE